MDNLHYNINTSNLVIDNNQTKPLLKVTKLSITSEINDKIVNTVIFNQNTITKIEYNDIVLNDYKRLTKLLTITHIIHILKLDINKLYDIKVLKLLESQNPNILIMYGYEDVSIRKFIEVHEKLDKMVEPIRNLKLSPLEKYLYVFNLTTHVKEYKYQEFLEDKGLSLFEIFDEDNNLIVCGGFAKILDELGKRVGINISKYRLEIFDGKDTEIHVRNVINMDDSKYNISGLYISDPTFNNDLSIELYTTALMSIEESSEFDNNNICSSFEMLLNFTSYEEFINLVTYDFKSNNLLNFKDLIDKLSILYKDILFLSESTSQKDYYSLYTNQVFMLNLYNFLTNIINKRVNVDIIIQALVNLKKKLNPDISTEELYIYQEEIISNYKKHYLAHFNKQLENKKNK